MNPKDKAQINALIRTTKPELKLSSLRERLENKRSNGAAVLLLDISGSMASSVSGGWGEDSETRIDALRNIVAELPEMPTYAFDSKFEEVFDKNIPDPRGGTDLTKALGILAEMGKTSVILITDGVPNDPPSALEAARAFNLTAIYVGPDPMPQFMRDLNALPNATASRELLSAEGQKAIVSKIKGLLK
jgi:hypothetical protein